MSVGRDSCSTPNRTQRQVRLRAQHEGAVIEVGHDAARATAGARSARRASVERKTSIPRRTNLAFGSGSDRRPPHLPQRLALPRERVPGAGDPSRRGQPGCSRRQGGQGWYLSKCGRRARGQPRHGRHRPARAPDGHRGHPRALSVSGSAPGHRRVVGVSLACRAATQHPETSLPAPMTPIVVSLDGHALFSPIGRWKQACDPGRLRQWAVEAPILVPTRYHLGPDEHPTYSELYPTIRATGRYIAIG